MSTMSALSCVWSPGKFITLRTIVEKHLVGALFHYSIRNIQLKVIVAVFE